MLLGEIGVIVWAVLASLAAAKQPTTPTMWISFGMLCTVATVHVWITRAAEERRRIAKLTREYVDHTGIWTMTAAMVLPAYLVVSVVLAIRGHRWTLAHKPAAQVVYGTAGIIGSALAANACSPLQDLINGQSRITIGDPLADTFILPLVAAASAYYAVQTIMFAIGRALRTDSRRQQSATDVPQTELARNPAERASSLSRWRRTRASLVQALQRAQRRWCSQNTIGTRSENLDFAATIAYGLIGSLLICLSPDLIVLVSGAAIFWSWNTKERDDSTIQSHVDSLTGLLNVRGFEERALTRLADDVAADAPSALLMFDLDYFKKINDRYGHPTGNIVLVAFADALRAHSRDTDLLCRAGGEEIMVLLPSTGPDEALTIADRFRTAVKDLAIDATRRIGGGQSTIKLTVSIGVALQPQDGKTLSALASAADAAVYTAKDRGRDQVCATSTSRTETSANVGSALVLHSRVAPGV